MELYEASTTDGYYYRIKAICGQMRAMNWLSTTIQFAFVTDFNPVIHK
ncbi:unnamed protein product, partial [Rotaria sp. Silwood1]